MHSSDMLVYEPFSLRPEPQTVPRTKQSRVAQNQPHGTQIQGVQWGLASVAEDAPSGCDAHALEDYLGPIWSTHTRAIPQSLASHTVSEITHLTWATQPVLLDAFLKLTVSILGISWMK